MKTIKLVEILNYYEVPQIFLGVNDSGIPCVCTLYDDTDEDCFIYVGVEISMSRLNELLCGKIDLRNIYTNHEQKCSLLRVYVRYQSITAEEMPDSDLEERMLPEDGYYFNPEHFVKKSSADKKSLYITQDDIDQMINSKKTKDHPQV